MNARKVLSEETISLELKSSSKEDIIREMIDIMAAAGRLEDREAALECVLARERKMSTGMQHGIAIPHGKTDTVSDIVAALALKKEGVDFGSLDGEPSKIFIMTISPASRSGPHIQFLAEISRALSNPGVRNQLLLARSRRDVVSLLA
ncbi:MAG: PTS sugar transporter subunit IIA [Kiritimatiellae bacterium]|nr:PTS sugar transporter subunit IIA [Kiritimatiellia bacterium]